MPHVMATALNLDTQPQHVALVHAARPRARDRERWLRRLLNTCVAALGLVVTSPLLLLIAVMIKLTSRGPVLFTQKRVGLDRRTLSRVGGNTRRRLDLGGSPFTIYKFRTMRVASGPDAQVWAEPDDARVTAIGGGLPALRVGEGPPPGHVLRGGMKNLRPPPWQPGGFLCFRGQSQGGPPRPSARPRIPRRG